MSDETTKWNPLLSDELCDEWDQCDCVGSGGSHKAQEFYEDLIATSKLRVVKEVDVDPFDHVYQCSGMHVIGPSMDCVNYCPGCGDKIQKP